VKKIQSKKEEEKVKRKNAFFYYFVCASREISLKLYEMASASR
jgi:hypothetical protein